MVSKENFLKYIDKVKLNTTALEKLNDAVGVHIWENGLSCLANNSDFVASLLMDIRSDYYEGFVQDYWNIMDKGKSDFKIYDKSLIEIEHITLHSWEEFYDYWRKTIEKS